MKKTITLLGLACVLALFTGCETTNVAPVQPRRTSATFAASKDRIWPLLVSEVGLNYPTQAIEKDSGLIATSWVTMPAGFNNMNAAQWIYPPGGFLATWDGLRMNMKILAVEAEAGKTQITINCHFEAFESNVQKAWLVARTNGAVEDDILTRVEAKLASAPAEAPKPETAPAAPGKSTAETLRELKQLLEGGLITQEEHDAKKKALLEKL